MFFAPLTNLNLSKLRRRSKEEKENHQTSDLGHCAKIRLHKASTNHVVNSVSHSYWGLDH